MCTSFSSYLTLPIPLSFVTTRCMNPAMAKPSRAIRAQWLQSTITQQCLQPTASRRFNSTFAHLQTDLPKRQIDPTFTDLSPQSSYRLETTLADFLPSSHPDPPAVLYPTNPAKEMPVAHHLLYFEPSKRSSEMLPDGTNPDHAPGDPFVRRMWAGGRVLYNNNNTFLLDGKRGVCAEFIRNVTVKGKAGDEKVFVSIERRLAKASEKEEQSLAAAFEGGQAKKDLDHLVRQRLWRASEEDFGECSILETRNIVFMRARTPDQAHAEATKSGGKALKPEHPPDYTHTITPDPKLLFRFSALTFNAHAIHLDPEYSRQIEGHRNLLFHGPLSFTFLMTLLQGQLAQSGNEVVKSVEYRNTAPLYCHEPVKFCGTDTGRRKWEVWAETPGGGVAVRGKVVTEEGRIDKSNLGI